MVEVTEYEDNGRSNKSTVNTAYRGPGDDFPFMAFNILGGTHILLATAMIITGIIHIALGDQDRLFFLLTGGVSLWCPMAALATGIIGAVMSNRRHWEVQCIKHAFLGMNLVTAFLFMIPLAVVTGLIDFYHYNVAKVDFIEDFLGLSGGMQQQVDDRVALMWVIVALACLEFLVCILSASICCCCAGLYMEAENSMPQEQQIVIKQQTPPPIYVEKTPQPQPTIVVQKPAPRPQPIFVQAPPQRQMAPIIVQAPAPAPTMVRPPMPMVMPPPPMAMTQPMPMPMAQPMPQPIAQPIYGGLPMMRRSVRQVRRPRNTIF